MIISRKHIEQMRSHGRQRIDAELEQLILDEYGGEPLPYVRTEQDLHEQIRKLITEYNRAHPDPRLNSLKPWEPTTTAADESTATEGAKRSN